MLIAGLSYFDPPSPAILACSGFPGHAYHLALDMRRDGDLRNYSRLVNCVFRSEWDLLLFCFWTVTVKITYESSSGCHHGAA